MASLAVWLGRHTHHLAYPSLIQKTLCRREIQASAQGRSECLTELIISSRLGARATCLDCAKIPRCVYPVLGTNHKGQSGFICLGTLYGSCCGAFSGFLRACRNPTTPDTRRQTDSEAAPGLTAQPHRGPQNRHMFRYPFLGTAFVFARSRTKKRHENRCQKWSPGMKRLIACWLRMV